MHDADGDDLGDAVYAVVIKPGDEIHRQNGERLRVLDVVVFDEEDAKLAGILNVKAA